MIKGILFDKDGTLIDFNATWLAAYIQAANSIAESVGQPELADSLLRSGGYDRVTGQWRADSLLASGSNRQILDFWSQQLGQPLTGSRLAEIRDIFSRAANNPTPAIGNLREFLLGLKARGLQSGLATMDDERNAVAMIEKFDLKGCFDFVCGADSGYGEKPDPGMVEAFCRHCQLRPDQVIMVGDSPKDIHMGIHAGVARAIGVLTGSHDRHELGKHTDTVLDNIAELENLLNDLKPPPDPASYCKPDRKTLRARLNDIQYRVTQQDATERPFDNQYNDEKREGIYVDIVSGEPLFSSTDKFDSGTGWPSFSRPLHPHCVIEKTDYQLFMRRTEVRSRHADSHLGHVFPDGPAPTGLRYCMNSAALRFIPKESMQSENYGQYLSLFEPASPEKAVPNTGPAPAHKED